MCVSTPGTPQLAHQTPHDAPSQNCGGSFETASWGEGGGHAPRLQLEARATHFPTAVIGDFRREQEAIRRRESKLEIRNSEITNRQLQMARSSDDLILQSAIENSAQDCVYAADLPARRQRQLFARRSPRREPPRGQFRPLPPHPDPYPGGLSAHARGIKPPAPYRITNRAVATPPPDWGWLLCPGNF